MSDYSLSLDESCLVLNKNYAVINVVKAWRALSLLTRGRAEVVYVEDGYYKSYSLDSWFALSEIRIAEGINSDESYIQGVEKRIILPRIIRTIFYDKNPARKTVLTRRNVYLRDANTCQLCGIKLPSTELNLDHVIPKSRGGKTTWLNVVCSCIKCNSKKGDRTLTEAGMKLLRKPFIPRYNLTLYERSKELKYKSWNDFLKEAYFNVELLP